MTSPIAPRPEDPSVDHSLPTGDESRSAAAPPPGATTLAEVIADSGPMPADVVLECIQRLAERLSVTTTPAQRPLNATNVLIDDNGDVWLSSQDSRGQPGRFDPADGMDEIGRLLAFLATGNGDHLTDPKQVDSTALPPPLSSIAHRLFSENGAGYLSYGDLACDAAALRGSPSAVSSPSAPTKRDAHSDPGETLAALEETRPPEQIEPIRKQDLGEVPSATSGAKFLIAASAAAVIGAALAFAVWQWL